VSTFSGLNTASTALWASQRAMEVTGQNVANANTDGYSRQRVDLQSIAAGTQPTLWSTRQNVGQGVDADSVQRIRDALLEARAQNEHGSQASLTVQSTALTQIEAALREPGDTGLQSRLSDMWAGWSDVANNPQEPGARAEVLQRSATVVSTLHEASGALTTQWADTHDSLAAMVKDVNASLTQIAGLDKAITHAQATGLDSNELQDKRDSLVMDLSDKIGATSSIAADGSFTVSLGGTTLVQGTSALRVSLTGSTDPTAVSSSPPALVTVPGGTTLRAGGTAQGDLAAMTTLIPSYLKQLDGIAQQLATQVNTAHQQGYDLSGTKGGVVFDNGSGATTGITAASIHLAISDPSKLAAASLDPTAAGGTPSADAGNAHALNALSLDPAGTDATYRKMVVSLGVQSSTAAGDLSAQQAMATQVDASRESVSGVNMDDEMTNMLQYQHAYAAAGKLVSAIDQMLDTVINMVGS
jgi:flagellar hook-associated protein 1 FlgK